MTLLVMGSCCPDCGCCDFYCADCYDKYLPKLEAIADAAQAVVAEPSLLWPYEEDGRALALVDALDVYDALSKEQ